MDPDPFVRLGFSHHARERWRERFGGSLEQATARGEIRCAILEGRWSHDQPEWARLHGHPPARPEDYVVFVWPSSCARAWVIILGTGPSALVKTLLVGAQERRDRDLRAIDTRSVRVGYVRR